MDRVFAIHIGSQGFKSQWGTGLNDFCCPIDQDIRTQCALSWKIVVPEWRSVTAVSHTERRQWRPPYQTGKTVHVHANTLPHYQHDEDGCRALGMSGRGTIPLSHSGNVIIRIGLHTHIFSVKQWTTSPKSYFQINVPAFIKAPHFFL